MTMFNITDGKNNISRDKPVDHIDMVNGLHVSAWRAPERHGVAGRERLRCFCVSAS